MSNKIHYSVTQGASAEHYINVEDEQGTAVDILSLYSEVEIDSRQRYKFISRGKEVVKLSYQDGTLAISGNTISFDLASEAKPGTYPIHFNFYRKGVERPDVLIKGTITVEPAL